MVAFLMRFISIFVLLHLFASSFMRSFDLEILQLNFHLLSSILSRFAYIYLSFLNKKERKLNNEMDRKFCD